MAETYVARSRFLDWAIPDVGEEEIAEVVDTLRSGWLTTGPKVKRFEAAFAEYVGARHAIALNSCTAGLHISLVARDIGPGDEVLVPTFTFCASANVVIHTGARPVLVDVRPDTLSIDVEQARARLTERTRAIVAVDYAGQPCDLDELRALADERGLMLIEDAAHAAGAEYRGRKVGTQADTTAFSFYANKNLSTGEGGMLTTESDDLADRLRMLSLHGMSRDAWKRYTAEGRWAYEVVEPGYKYNMTDIAASLGLHQLAKLDDAMRVREQYARRYDEAFAQLPQIERLSTLADRRNALHLYPILLRLDRLSISRDRFIVELQERRIGTSVHFIPVHLHPVYRDRFGYARGDFPVAEAAFERILSLPLYPRMTSDDVTDVIEAVRDVVGRFAR